MSKTIIIMPYRESRESEKYSDDQFGRPDDEICYLGSENESCPKSSYEGFSHLNDLIMGEFIPKKS